MNYLIAFYIEFFVVTLLMPFAIKGAHRMGIVDFPDYRKVHSDPIPRIGGMVIALSVLVVFYLISTTSLFLYVFLISGSIVLLAGLVDDCICLNYRYKFIAQIAASCFFVIASGMRIPFLYSLFGLSEQLYVYADILLTSIFIVGTINIINLSDGLDALASGLAIISFIVIAYIAYDSKQSNILGIAILMIGSILAFMRFNVFPAKIFMGDTGSQFIGFVLGSSIVLLAYERHFTVLDVGVIPYLLGIPLLDTLNVIYLRIRNKKNPFLPDKNHIHHKLISLNIPQYQAVVCIYVAHLFLLALGLAIRGMGSGTLFSLYIFLAASFLLAFNKCQFSSVLNFFSKFHRFSEFQVRIGGSSIAFSRHDVSRIFWNLFFLCLSFYYVFFSLTISNVDMSLLTLFLVILLLSLFLCFVFKYDHVVLYKIIFYFFNIVILIYSRDHFVFTMNNGLVAIGLIDLFLVSIFFLYFICISLTAEKVPVNSIDFLMLMGIFLLIFVSTYESSLMYYLRIVIRFVLISFFINLIFSRFRRNMKYISFLIVYLFVVFVFKSMVQ